MLAKISGSEEYFIISTADSKYSGGINDPSPYLSN
jgi:hypothetical protein